jgi:formiminotetrahydrofolate cyclodeaminase
MTLAEFTGALSSSAPTPGGGGAAAAVAALSSSLCAMVLNLTTGKKKYAEFQPEIEALLQKLDGLTPELLGYIDRDAEAFAPLAAAYGIPKDEPGRAETLEAALVAAAKVPLALLQTLRTEAVPVIARLNAIGSRLVISDGAVAASLCRAAAEGAYVNIRVNTRLMRDREAAQAFDAEAAEALRDVSRRCGSAYDDIMKGLTD